MTPFEQAVEAMVGFPKQEFCPRYGEDRHTCRQCAHAREWSATAFDLQRALPHLRRMHFQEAAELLAVEWGRDNPTLVSAGFDEAASFLRGVQ